MRAIQAFEDMQEVAATQLQEAPETASEEEEKKDWRSELYEREYSPKKKRRRLQVETLEPSDDEEEEDEKQIKPKPQKGDSGKHVGGKDEGDADNKDRAGDIVKDTPNEQAAVPAES